MKTFTDLMPLRLTSVWSSFRAIEVIPHRYGFGKGVLIQYNKTRKLFVWADHPSVNVIVVKVGGQLVNNWRWFNALDSTGHGVTFVEFGQSIAEDTVVEAIGTGKIHPRAGGPILNAADVLWDLMANVCGMNVTEAEFDPLRAQCQKEDIQLAGELVTNTISIQTQIVEICKGIGAVFCSTMKGFARLYPGVELDSYEACKLDNKYSVESTADRELIRNSLVVNFDYDSSGPRQTITVECPDSITRYGRRQDTIDARWVTATRIAFGVADRRLQWRARPVYRVVAGEFLSDQITAGQTVATDHVLVPFTGNSMILATELRPDAELTKIVFEIAVGDVPVTAIVQQSAIIAAQQYASVTVQTVGDERVLTVVDPQGHPLANARCVLDKQTVRFSDDAGRVVFPVSLMPVGTHSIEVTYGSQVFTFEVLIQ